MTKLTPAVYYNYTGKDFPKEKVLLLALNDSRNPIISRSNGQEWVVLPYELEEINTAGSSMILPTDSTQRKKIPITTGLIDYFPLAVAEVANASYNGNLQHHADKPLHWDKTKSTDHADCIARHLVDRGKFDTDGVRHSAKLAWRALALLQLELEKEQNE